MNKSNRWLNEFSKDVYSQSGEDGILAKVLDTLPETDNWCVEFGAWDGKHFSNTYNLVENKDYSVVYIEGDKERFVDLKRNLAGNENAIALNTFVGFAEDDSLDHLLKETPIPVNFDILSIDIDGNDYHVWDVVRQYTPKVVIIEYNPTIPDAVDFVQPKDMNISHGNSLRALNRLANDKGYELICTTRTNSIFVDKKYYDLFNISDNSIEVLHGDDAWVTYIFSGYDGSVLISGNGKVGWNHVPYSIKKLQQVPGWLRGYPGNNGKFKTFVLNLYRSLRKRRIL